MSKKGPKRPKNYEKRLELRDGVEFEDLINLSLNKEKKPKKKAAPKKKKSKK